MGNLDQDVSQLLPGGSVASGDLLNLTSNFWAPTISRLLGVTNADMVALNNSLKAIDPALDLAKVGSDAQAIQDYYNLILTKVKAGTLFHQPQPFVFSLQNLDSTFPGPAKFYDDTNKITSQRWVFPVPPSDFNVAVPSSPTTVTTINGFMFTHAGPIDLDEISFDGFFPFWAAGEGDKPNFIPDYIIMDTSKGASELVYRTPHDWVQTLVTAMRANQPLIFSVYASDATNAIVTTKGIIVEPTVMSVSAFSWKMGTAVGGTRRDIEFSITLKRWRRQTLEISNYVGNLNPGAGGGHGTRKHKVTAKDTLWIIAGRPVKGKPPGLGKHSRWKKEIWKLNTAQKKLIDDAYAKYKKEDHHGKVKSIKDFHLFKYLPKHHRVLMIPKA
jgi:hypothetical protein